MNKAGLMSSIGQKTHIDLDMATIMMMVGSLLGIYFGNAIGLILFALTSFLSAYQLHARYGGLRKNFAAYLKSPIVIIFGLLMLSLVISSSMATDKPESFKTIAEQFTICFCGAAVALHIGHMPKSCMDFFLKIFFYASIAVCGAMLVEMYTMKFFHMDFHKGSIMNASRKIGTAFAVLLPYMLTYAFLREKKWLWVGVTFLCLVVFTTGGRTGILALISAAAIFSLMFPWPLLKKWKQSAYSFWASLIASGAIGTFLYYNMVGGEKFGYRISGYDATTGSGRTDLWIYLLHKFTDHFFWGIGPKNFQTLGISLDHVSSYMHPHNMMIELLVETGVIGLGLFIVLGLAILCKMLTALYKRNSYDIGSYFLIAQATLVSLFTFMIAAQFLTSIFHGWWVMYLVLLLAILGGMCISLSRTQKEKSKSLGHDLTSTYPVAVSVIMPCHNGAKFLGEAIESVLAQTYSSWELLVIDDGSSDNSYHIMQDYASRDSRIKTFQHPVASGEGAARNTLIRNAQGRYIAFLDCDDKWHADKLSLQVAFMEKSGCPLSHGRYRVINEASEPVRQSFSARPIITMNQMFYTNDIGCPTAMYDSAVFGQRQMGNYKRNTDMLFWIDLLKDVRFASAVDTDTAIADYRVHKGGVSYNKVAMAKAHWKTYREELSVPLPFAVYYFGRYMLRGILKTYFSRKA